MRTALLLSISLLALATPIASAEPTPRDLPPMYCSAEPPEWYEICEATKPEALLPVVTDLVLCLTFDHSKCPT